MGTLVNRIKPVGLEYPNSCDSGNDAKEENEKRISQLTLSDYHTASRTHLPIYKLNRSAGSRSLGRHVATLVEGEQDARYHEAQNERSRCFSLGPPYFEVYRTELKHESAERMKSVEFAGAALTAG
jgi:hypothetical protein